MTSKHTPGPWDCGVDENGRGIIFINRGIGNHIAYLSDGGVPDDQEEANARLIASAPDLLEALRPFSGLVDTPSMARLWPDDRVLMAFDDYAITMGMVRAARAAIAKAEGRP